MSRISRQASILYGRDLSTHGHFLQPQRDKETLIFFCMSRNKINLITILVSVFLFLCAVYIYISHRSLEMILYSWLGIDTSNNFFEWIRTHSCDTSSWVKYNLPDGLWMLSFLLFMEGMWDKNRRIKLFFCIPVIAVAFILEILQYSGRIQGTFDILDIVSYIIAITLYLFFNKLKQINYENI